MIKAPHGRRVRQSRSPSYGARARPGRQKARRRPGSGPRSLPVTVVTGPGPRPVTVAQEARAGPRPRRERCLRLTEGRGLSAGGGLPVPTVPPRGGPPRPRCRQPWQPEAVTAADRTAPACLGIEAAAASDSDGTVTVTRTSLSLSRVHHRMVPHGGPGTGRAGGRRAPAPAGSGGHRHGDRRRSATTCVEPVVEVGDSRRPWAPAASRVGVTVTQAAAPTPSRTVLSV